MNSYLTKPQFSTKIYRAYLGFISSHYPDINLDTLCLDAGLSKEYLLNPNHWVSLAFERGFSQHCIAATSDPDLHYKVGRIALDRDLIGAMIHSFTTSLASTKAMYKIAPQITQTLTTVYRVQVMSLALNRCSYLIECNADQLSATDLEILPEVMGYVINSLKGYYEAIPTLKNSPYATVSVSESVDQMGLPRYMVDVAYQEARVALPWWGWLGVSLAGIGVGLGCMLLGVSPAIALLLTTTLLLAVATSASYLAYRRHWTVAHETVATLEELKREHGRSHEANLLAQNRMKQLEAISAVTHSITINSSREELMRLGCQSLVERLGYDRAIIFLVDKQKRRLVYSGHAGDEERIASIFCGSSFDIDIPSDDPSKISNVYRNQKALLIADVRAHLPTLNAESQQLLRATESRSFICVPMASGGNCFGIIIVDCFLPGKEIGQTDLDLLITVGQQLAVAIEKLAAQQREFDALRDAIRLKEQFLANTTHELKTPLHGIIGLTESLLDDPVCRERPLVAKNLRFIMDSGRRLANLVDDVLTLSKAQHDAHLARREACDFDGLCRRLVTLLSRQFTNKGVTLTCTFDNDAATMMIDSARVEQVLMNLIGNALKFTDRGFVKVDAVVTPELDVNITIADSGIGIAASELSHIFAPFYQVEASGERRYGGAGLGLTIAREIILGHGGDIHVESMIGDGTTFMFNLKGAALTQGTMSGRTTLTSADLLAPEALVMDAADILLLGGNPTSKVASASVSDARDHILIVDDDSINVQVLLNHLTPLNYRVTTASDGRQCLDLMASGLRPDLILLDVMMPGMTGYGVCRKLRETHELNDLPIVFLTAKNQEADTLEGLQSGGNDFIRKPFSKSELLARIGLHSRLARFARASGRFVPWRGLDWLGYKSILDVRLGDAVDLDVTVLFTDLRDFTGITSGMESREIMRMVNSYINATAPVVTRNGGLIDKYLGDGMMALFHSPADGMRAAIQLAETVQEYNLVHRSGSRRASLSCRLALNSGPVTYGPMGYEERLELTPLSDVINVASRLDGLAKVLGATLIAAEHLITAAGVATDLPYRRLGRFSIRGRKEQIALAEILAGDDPLVISRKIASRELFEANVKLLEDDQVSRALDGFLALAKLDPEDMAVRHFLDRCQARVSALVRATVQKAA